MIKAIVSRNQNSSATRLLACRFGSGQLAVWLKAVASSEIIGIKTSLFVFFTVESKTRFTASEGLKRTRRFENNVVFLTICGIGDSSNCDVEL